MGRINYYSVGVGNNWVEIRSSHKEPRVLDTVLSVKRVRRSIVKFGYFKMPSGRWVPPRYKRTTEVVKLHSKTVDGGRLRGRVTNNDLRRLGFGHYIKSAQVYKLPSDTAANVLTFIRRNKD